MKGLFCAECWTIRSLPRTDMVPVRCDCGKMSGWWLDGAKGIARYWAFDREKGFMIGWNNTYLSGVVHQQMHHTNALARQLHNMCTDAPGFFFDSTKRNCWSIIMEPGMSNDTKWASEEEMVAVGLRREST